MTTAPTSSNLTSTLANNTTPTDADKDSPNSSGSGSGSGGGLGDDGGGSGSSGIKLANLATLDESATNGFTTAPATSEEDNLDYEESDDDDDSRSNYSTTNTNTNNSNNSTLTGSSGRRGRQYGRHSSLRGEETKRSHHNVLERKRRDLLKDSFSKLRDSVLATQPKERVSRAEILKQAADFIQSRVQKNASVRAELDDLIRKNQELEQIQKQRLDGGGATRLLGTIVPNKPKEPVIKREH